jgi:hypothetical protein
VEDGIRLTFTPNNDYTNRGLLCGPLSRKHQFCVQHLSCKHLILGFRPRSTLAYQRPAPSAGHLTFPPSKKRAPHLELSAKQLTNSQLSTLNCPRAGGKDARVLARCLPAAVGGRGAASRQRDNNERHWGQGAVMLRWTGPPDGSVG